MRDALGQTTLWLVAAFSILVSLADMFGFVESLPVLKGRTPTITLLAIGLLMGYVALERRTKIDNIEKLVRSGPDRIIRALDGVNVRKFRDAQDMYEYVVRRMREAKATIDDLTWGPAERGANQAARDAADKYIQTILTVCRKKTIAYREVMSFSAHDHPNHLNRAEAMLEKRLSGYQLRYYEFAKERIPPLLLFMVVDSEEVIVSCCRSPFLSSQREIQLAIRHPDIVRLFQDYYDTIWQAATDLKPGLGGDDDPLRSIRMRLSS